MNEIKSIMYRGIEHEVKIMAYPGKNTQVIFRDNKFFVYINNKLDGKKQEQEAAKGLRQWMTEKAQEIIKPRAQELSRKVGVSFNAIRIKDTKTRWGSCSSKGNLNFNFRLVMAPQETMDYIIIHELCHLRHMNHSKEFWNAVAQYMPDYEVHKKWLNKNGMKYYVI